MRKNASTIKTLIGFLGRDKYLLLTSLLCALATVALSLYAPVLTGDAVDMAVSQGNVDFSGIWRALTRLAVLAALYALFNWLASVVNNRLAFNAARAIRVSAFEKISRLPIKYLDARPVGEVLSRVISDVDQLSDGVLLGFTHLFTGVLTITGTLAFLIWTSPIVALVVAVLTPLSLIVASFIAKRSYSMFALRSKTRGEMTALIDETVGGMKTVKAFSRENARMDAFKRVNHAMEDASLRAIFFSSLTNPATRFVNAMVYAAVAVAGGILVIRGTLSVGELTRALSYAGSYAKPFNEISGVVAEFQNALACAARVFEFLDAEELPPDPPRAPAMHADAEGDVRMQNVCFSYDPSRKLIENLNLTARKGQRVAIVGPTGCGKTTLINLLMRYYEPDAGEIYIDGVPARAIPRGELRARFGMVLQDTWLRAGTVFENLRFGNPDAKDDMVIEAAKAADAHSFIMRLPNGYDTRLGEDGGSLSQGQKQLLSIARVMLRTPRMLILDEATSSIDTRTEQKIQAAFAKLMRGRTSFIVAHRLSTILGADVIVAMRDGQIVEMGTHAELLKKNGFYADLYMSQYR